MLGAIIGDMVGSVYQYKQIKTKNFPIFNIENYETDDTILTRAVARVLLQYYPINFGADNLKMLQDKLIMCFSNYCIGRKTAGWGANFYIWAHSPLSIKKPYNSFGNGSAMRISPVGWIAKSEEEVKILSKTVTEITHNHPEGLKGAEAIAMCIFLALHGKSKEQIEDYVVKNYYPRIADLDYSSLIADYDFDVTCQGSVPEAIFCFLISESLEDAIRNAVSIGGDSDTLAAMAGSIAEAYYQKNSLSSFENSFLYLFIDDETEKEIHDFHSAIKSDKFKKK